ncbi:hypothetical protein JTB14_017115 [Gonioctena quinquepunctata]|nr:hypothetical protein JTB14_017115 [Gonioctena quinquepunctata]
MCLKNGITQIDIAIDNGKWYEKLNQSDRASFMKDNHTEFPPIFPVNGWKKFPSEAIPKFFYYGIIYKHLVETVVIANERNTQSDEDEEIQKYNTSKPLKRGRIYFRSGIVTNIESWDNNQIYCLESLVMSSYANTNYTVMIMLDQNTGEVKDAACECVASAMGRCSHVSGTVSTFSEIF